MCKAETSYLACKEALKSCSKKSWGLNYQNARAPKKATSPHRQVCYAKVPWPWLGNIWIDTSPDPDTPDSSGALGPSYVLRTSIYPLRLKRMWRPWLCKGTSATLRICNHFSPPSLLRGPLKPLLETQRNATSPFAKSCFQAPCFTGVGYKRTPQASYFLFQSLWPGQPLLLQAPALLVGQRSQRRVAGYLLPSVSLDMG